jgi:monovalent cation:proton antiporter-2 (CPA2) family protein
VHAEEFFRQALVYLTAAVVSVPVAKRLGLGSVLGYLVAGVIVGPFGLGLVGEERQDVMHFAEFGVVMMLFLVGLELDPAMLWRLRGPILGLGGLQVALTASVGAGIALALGLSAPVALAVGLILAMSSTAIALQSLDEKGLLKTPGGQNAFAVLLFQDVAVIPILALLPLLAPRVAAAAAGAHEAGGDHAAGGGAGLSGWMQTFAVLGAVALIVVAGRFLVRPALRAIARTRLSELFTAAALLIVIAIATLMTKVGVSPALGTFLAGVILAGSEYRHELVSDIEPFKGLLLGLFFIAVGASIDFGLLAARPAAIAALVLAAIAVKLAVLAGLGRGFRLAAPDNAVFSLSLAQVGEFAFVLIAFAGTIGLFPAEVSGPFVAVVALSMAASPLLVALGEKVIVPRLRRAPASTREPDAIHEENPVIVAGFGRFGQIVARLLRAHGVGTTVLETDADQIDLLRRFSLQAHYGDASRVDLLRAAGADKARLLVLAIDNREKRLEMVHAVRRHFPRLRILARAEDMLDAYELMDAGVTDIYRETLDSSLRLGADALRLLGVRAYAAQRAARAFLRHDEESVRELAARRGDETEYVSAARERIADLERLMREDLGQRERSRDAGWDTESLREDLRRGGLAKDD